MIKSLSWIIHVPYISFIISSRFRSLFVRVINRAFILSCVYRALLCIIVSMTASTELCICALTQRITGMTIPTWMLQALFIRWYQWHTSCLERSKDYTGIDVSGEYMFLIMYKTNVLDQFTTNCSKFNLPPYTVQKCQNSHSTPAWSTLKLHAVFCRF